MLVCTSRGTCPGCGESLLDTKQVIALRCYLGTTKHSWTEYYCPVCKTEFRVYWPSLNETLARLAKIEAGEKLDWQQPET